MGLEHLVAEVVQRGDHGVGGDVVDGLVVGPALDAAQTVAGQLLGLHVDGAVADPGAQHAEAVAGQFAGEPRPQPAGELLQLQRQHQLLIGLKTPQSFQLFQLVGQFGGQIRVVEPGTDQALVDAMDVALVVRL